MSIPISEWLKSVSFHDMGNGQIGVALEGEMETNSDKVNTIVAILNEPKVTSLIINTTPFYKE